MSPTSSRFRRAAESSRRSPRARTSTGIRPSRRTGFASSSRGFLHPPTGPRAIRRIPPSTRSTRTVRTSRRAAGPAGQQGAAALPRHRSQRGPGSVASSLPSHAGPCADAAAGLAEPASGPRGRATGPRGGALRATERGGGGCRACRRAPIACASERATAAPSGRSSASSPCACAPDAPGTIGAPWTVLSASVQGEVRAARRPSPPGPRSSPRSRFAPVLAPWRR